MVRYPISIARESYRGSKQSIRQKIIDTNSNITVLEDAVNELLLRQKKPIQVYLYHELSSLTGLSLDFIRKHGYKIDCGGNGFTAVRHDLT